MASAATRDRATRAAPAARQEDATGATGGADGSHLGTRMHDLIADACFACLVLLLICCYASYRLGIDLTGDQEGVIAHPIARHVLRITLSTIVTVVGSRSAAGSALLDKTVGMILHLITVARAFHEKERN